ncbi:MULTISPECIES: 3'-5' exoribonuclease YhaM family protein [Bacillus cereus group]|uniref:3'-5' exonuclease n=2 Tax=Bacillus cereus TaxID=1396 RepID=A0A9X6VVU0_BACCE|nr:MULTISPECIES: HD domain-containing protein [Bacillus cereus group]PFF46112.1 3'-5' exonuclease [Bacillus cereus]PGB17965.1 3'-5' exonuclease [Bacillus toyonensis]
MVVNLSKLKKGDRINGVFLLKNINESIAKNNNPFFKFNVSNKTGSLECVLWEITEEYRTFFEKEFPVAHLTGKITEYEGKLQVKLGTLKEATEYNKDELVETVGMDANIIRAEVESTIENIKNKEIKLIVKTIFEPCKEKFYEHVAAKKFHHEVVGGLGYHVYTMLLSAKQLAKIYGANEDLICAGVILHDLGKLIEIENPLNPTYSVEGNLRGHIAIMDTAIQKTVAKLIQEKKLDKDSEVPLLLSHMVLSHHGQLDWGSPVTPKLKEALLLHFIDSIDAKMYQVNKHLENAESGAMFNVPEMKTDFFKPKYC